MIDEKLKILLNNEGYREFKEIPNVGICGLRAFAFTVGLCVGLDETGYKYRYCYPIQNVNDAIQDFEKWDGVGHPKGNWIKRKGEGIDETNLNFIRNENISR